jgi:PAS domain S-box-containing protein
VRSTADATALGMAYVLETRADGTRRFVFAGPRCLAVNGIDAEAIMTDAQAFFDMILPEHRPAFEAAEAEAAATLQPFDIEVAMRRPDGEVRWHRLASLQRRQTDGTVFWDGLQVDVTDRREMAAALLEQRRRLEVAVETTGLGFWEWDVAAGTLRWSVRNKALFGLEPDAHVSLERYLELVHPEDVEAVQDAFRSAFNGAGGDYAVDHRIVTPAAEVRWIQAHGRVATDETGEARLVVGTSLDITARKASEERRALLLGELAHRAKNGIAVLMAIVSQTARTAETVEAFEEQIMARLQAMAASQDLVTASGGGPVVLADVIGKALAPFGNARLDIDPSLDAITIRGDLAAGMGLLLHEMATNAVKYGALSNARGRVSVLAADASAEGRGAFTWREAGGPPVQTTNKPGFGTRLLQQVLRPQGGEVQFEFAAEGFHARAEFPAVR